MDWLYPATQTPKAYGTKYHKHWKKTLKVRPAVYFQVQNYEQPHYSFLYHKYSFNGENINLM